MFKNIWLVGASIAIVSVVIMSVAAVPRPLSAAEAQSHVGIATETGPVIPADMLPTEGRIGPVGIVNELREAHSTITNIMIDHTNMNYSRAENIIFTMTVVDYETKKLNVVLDPVLLTLGLAYDESDVVDLLEIDKDMINVKYGVFIPDSHISPSPQSSITQWISLYDSRCSTPTASRLCEALFFNLGTQNHYTLDASNRWHPPGTTEAAHSPKPTVSDPVPVHDPAELSTTIFLDEFESGMNNWTQTGRYNWEVGDFDENVHPQERDNTNSVASADRCSIQCVITLTDPIDLSSENHTVLTFHRYVDRSLDSGEYLQVDVTNGDGTWTQLAKWVGNSGDDDNQWHFERFDITDYISDAFQVRFAAKMSASSEDVGIDDVMISRVYEFYGGNNYTMHFINDGMPDGRMGTITVGFTNDSTGVKGILTAGHVVVLFENTQEFVNHTVSNNDILLNREANAWIEAESADAAFVPIKDPNIIISNKIQALNGTIMNVTYGNLSDLAKWSKVYIYGARTNDDGWLFYKNATITSGTRILPNMGIANYDSKSGDSGAPVIHYNASGSNNLVGIHMGGACVFSAPSEGLTGMANLTNTDWCNHSEDAYYYTAFTPLENAISALNLK